ncbi:hypothetical protein BN946_scf185015.g41 [Trametes cinnabarina]|uniref:Ribonuclease n=1 Tax=Pycnoporus cinnabarinus TaxID=5643 RepID=A0A060SMR1_PYCCI|nr:hypothetical protein BN946_scf185015.g41 [Trametes cinnabarina]
MPTRHDYFPEPAMEAQAEKPTALIPIRVEFETETHRIRDCFMWNLNEVLITPESFARIFCADLDLPLTPWVDTIAAQIRAQIEDHEGIASTYLGADAEMSEPEDETPGEEVNECRVILSIDVQIATHHLLDHIEWDLLSPLTPEEFSIKLCTELGLAGEAAPLIAHAIHEEIIKHKRDAIEWGVIGGENARDVSGAAADEGTPTVERPRDKSGQSLLKDKTGLGLAWGRAPKDGRGPKPLKSVWRDWAEAEEFTTRFEVLTAEEVERRELERERATRRDRKHRVQQHLLATHLIGSHQTFDLIMDPTADDAVAAGIPSIADPSLPLIDSYSYHSPTPTAPGPYILGVDEAGRGPVLGPLVYGVAYCPVAYKESLEELGFADSKTLTAQVRSSLLETLCSDPPNLGWSVRVLSPKAISAGMLRRPPVNLNQQSQEATVLLIREVLARGIHLSEVYVDALGKTAPYEAYLSSLFPDISFTVTAKADQKFKIVGAASVAAKVTRDALIEGWVYEELHVPPSAGGGDRDENASVQARWAEDTGSGYPSDPKTQAWIKNSLDPIFGYPSLARFSWATIKVVLEKDAYPVKWIDDGQASLIKAFESGIGRDKDRCAVAKDLGLESVGML